MKATYLLVLALCAASVACAQDTVTVNSGAVFFLGNDLGKGPFTLAIYNDSLHINGYAVGMRKSQEWDIADRNPGPPDPVNSRAFSIADSLRHVSGVTQQLLTKAMKAFYAQQPTVQSVNVKDEAAGSIQVLYRGYRNYIGYRFPLVDVPHVPPTKDVKLEGLRRQMAEYAHALETGGMLLVGDGGMTWAQRGAFGANMAARIRSALQTRTSSSISAVFEGTRECIWVKRELKNQPRPLPGLR